MKSRALLTVLIAAFLAPAYAGPARETTDRSVGRFVLDMGSVQLDANAINREALSGQWKPLAKQLSSLEKSAASIGTYAGAAPSQKPAVDALQRDVPLLHAAILSHDVDKIAALAQSINTDVTELAASDQRL